MSKKIIIEEGVLLQLINEEIGKFQRKLQLEAEKESILRKLNEMTEEDEGNDIDEGLGSWLSQKVGLKDTPEVIQARKEKIMANFEKAKSAGYKKFQLDGKQVDEDGMISGMEKNGYTGTLLPIQKAGILAYKSGPYGASRLASGGSSQGLGV